ncbi:MAG: helix-turn-helix domain-containing protein [Caulobacterales bacterium]|nr:helix-turn-helix domain-containing protein [Caulobacterales bacterium]
MTRRARRKSPQKRLSDPGQLGLFDAVETAATTPAKQPKPAKSSRVKPASSPARERPVVLSPREAAQYLGVSVSTLKAWRAKKIGPKWTMRGARLIAYRPADLERFLDESSAGR